VNRYPNIADHGLIGDLQTAALVTTDGTVDWFCTPRFDSPSVFASLLDADHGGYFRVSPDTDQYVTKQLYFPDTAILITRFMTEDGVGEVHDFMPVIEGAATDRHRLVRHLHVVRGTMRFVMDIQPAFDYARKPHKLDVTENGAVFQADGLELTLHAAGLVGNDPELKLERRGDGLRASRTLQVGQSGGIVLESMGGQPQQMTVEELDRLERDTANFWRAWVHRSTYTGRCRSSGRRSPSS
jgi:GH15 family glucan-1,4-alpha-glucosidase